MNIFMKKAKLHDIQFKKSQIQWNPITTVYHWKASAYNASQLHSPEHKHYVEQIHYIFWLYNPSSRVVMGSHHRCFLIVKQWFPFKYYENMDFQEISLSLFYLTWLNFIRVILSFFLKKTQ